MALVSQYFFEGYIELMEPEEGSESVMMMRFKIFSRLWTMTGSTDQPGLPASPLLDFFISLEKGSPVKLMGYPPLRSIKVTELCREEEDDRQQLIRTGSGGSFGFSSVLYPPLLNIVADYAYTFWPVTQRASDKLSSC